MFQFLKATEFRQMSIDNTNKSYCFKYIIEKDLTHYMFLK